MKLLKAARTESLDRYALLLIALRAGLRRGEVVALQWGDFQFGTDDATVARYIEVRRNYVYGRFTTPKGHKSRRVDMSSELRATLLELRDARLLKAFAGGESSITKAFVFPSATGGVLDPDNMIRDRFLPNLEAAGIRAVRFHDLRHTFGAMLIAAGAPLNYVKEQMGHASIQVTVDTYGHLIPGVGERYVDRLDSATSPQQSATPAQPVAQPDEPESLQVIALIGSGGENRTPDLGIMRPSRGMIGHLFIPQIAYSPANSLDLSGVRFEGSNQNFL
jgi:integrase